MLIQTLKSLFNRDLDKLSQEINAYKNEKNIWLTEDGISNSAGNLCLHLLGNLNTYIGAEIGKTGYIRNRELEFSMKDAEVDKVQLYIDAARENDEVISKGIEPVNIMDNYSAGWLSPEGLYYALNGEIANMLHIQIADALQEKGVVPEKDEFDSGINASAWLEQAGWVKIHESTVHFGGCLNERLDKKNVDMTKTQIDIIYQYISKLHNGIMKLGWREQPVSIARFMMEADNLEGLYQRHFNY